MSRADGLRQDDVVLLEGARLSWARWIVKTIGRRGDEVSLRELEELGAEAEVRVLGRSGRGDDLSHRSIANALRGLTKAGVLSYRRDEGTTKWKLTGKRRYDPYKDF